MYHRGAGCRQPYLKERNRYDPAHHKGHRDSHPEGSDYPLGHYKPGLAQAVEESQKAEQECCKQAVYGV